MRTRPTPHIHGFTRKAARTEPRLSDLILAYIAVLVLALGCLSLLLLASA